MIVKKQKILGFINICNQTLGLVQQQVIIKKNYNHDNFNNIYLAKLDDIGVIKAETKNK